MTKNSWKTNLIENGITIIFAISMVVAGTINTICFKMQDLQKVKGLGDGPPRVFEHPFSQSILMFCGMAVCLLFYYPQKLYGFIKEKYLNKNSSSNENKHILKGNVQKKYNDDEVHEKPIDSDNSNEVQEKPIDSENNEDDTNEENKVKGKVKPPAPNWVFIIPSLCDLVATTLLNFGLIYIQASVYQMLTYSVLFFSCVSSVIILRDKRYIHHWVCVGIIIIGAVIVGLSSILFRDPTTSAEVARNPVLGILFIISSQVLQALQMVYEELYLEEYDVIPLQCAGWEGIWGIMQCFMFLIVVYLLPGSDFRSFESAPFAFVQLINSPTLILCSLGIIFGCFTLNYTGITLTQRLNNTARSTIDTMRTICIWVVSLAIGWEKFNWMQIGGFSIMIFGTLTYNDVIAIPYYTGWYKKIKKRDDDYKEQNPPKSYTKIIIDFCKNLNA